MTKSSIYRVWADMKNRCYNERLVGYANYGGRGISVCDQWFYSFICFYEDMAYGYSENLQLDRIDNNGNYCKENCRWATNAINSVNKRRQNGVHLAGVSLTSKTGKYVAKMTANNHSYNIGSFESELEAHNAYLLMHKEWYGC